MKILIDRTSYAELNMTQACIIKIKKSYLHEIL